MHALTPTHASEPRRARLGPDEPILLLGSTRSGTTLLSLMLGHHPQIAFVGELEWVWDHPLERADPEGPPPADYYAWLATHRHLHHHRLRVDRSLGLAGLARSFLGQMREHADPKALKPRFGCQVHRHYARALATWPKARVLHIVRDGRDVCASWLRLDWLGNAYEGGRRWRDAITQWEAARSSLDRSLRLELRFEDLVREPEGELRRISDFLGVPYDEAMLRFHEDTTYGPVDPGQEGKWRGELSRRDVRLFETVAGQALTGSGYALSGELPYRLGPWTRAALVLDHKIRRHRARARIFGLRLWLGDVVTHRIGPRWLRDRVRLELNAIEEGMVK